MNNLISFEEKQFDRIFPFHLLIAEDMEILSAGSSLKKICSNCTKTLFSEKFEIKRPQVTHISIDALLLLRNQLVVLAIKNPLKTILRGQFEWIADKKQLLFLGSPWFGNMEMVAESALSIHDFALHDPLIDLLHVLNLQEITNDDLKQVLAQLREKKEALKIKEEKYRNIIANINLGLLEVNNDDTVLYANQAFCDMSGYTLAELTGKKASALLLSEKSKQLLASKNKLREKSISDAYEIPVTDKSGQNKWWLISGAPNYNDKGERIGSIGIHLDITPQKQLQFDLLEAKNNAEASTRAKEMFLANMSHEIRTPMNAIMGMAAQLKKTGLTGRQQFYLGSLQTAAENLLVIINDILDLSKIEAGKLTLENVDFNLYSVLTRAIEVMQHKAEEKGLLLEIAHYDPAIAAVFKGDPFRINQVLLNLLSNAVKFTEKGAVKVYCSLTTNDHMKQELILEVADTGVGMDPAYTEKIFQVFSQEDNSVTRKFGGTGLGMSICKQLTELMGGRIEVQSRKNEGTRVLVTVSLQKGSVENIPATEDTVTDVSVFRDKKILVTDDNKMNRLIAAAILRNYGCEITMAGDGAEAIQKIAENHFDLVLMDIQMPVMDGIEATKRIRNEISSTLPVIALTALALKGDNEKCIEAGMSDYLSKPFMEEELLLVCSRWLKQNNERLFAGELFSFDQLKTEHNNDNGFEKNARNQLTQDAIYVLEQCRKNFATGNTRQLKAVMSHFKTTVERFNIHSLKSITASIENDAEKLFAENRLGPMITAIESVLSAIISKLK